MLLEIFVPAEAQAFHCVVHQTTVLFIIRQSTDRTSLNSLQAAVTVAGAEPRLVVFAQPIDYFVLLIPFTSSA